MSSLSREEVQQIITDFNKIAERESAHKAKRTMKMTIIIVVIVLIIIVAGGYYYMRSKQNGTKIKLPGILNGLGGTAPANNVVASPLASAPPVQINL